MKFRNFKNKKNNNNLTKDCLTLLSMLFLTIMLGTYLLAYKMVSIFGYTISGGIFIFPINYSIIDIITEIYGNDETKKLIKLSFICCLFFSLFIPLIAILPSPEGWSYQPGYTYILGNVFRFFIANTIGIIIGIRINSYLISKWKIKLQGKYFWLRSIGSSSIGELVTSIIADIIAFIGTTSILGVVKLMLGIFSIKIIYSILLSLPSSLIVAHLKLKFGLNFSDNQFNFNPFNQNNNDLKESNAFNH